jgi:hypothetical protein
MANYTALLTITAKAAKAAKAEGQASLAVARTVAAIAWDWYIGTFFSDAAMARYEVAGRYLYTAAMVAYGLGVMARRWVDAQVTEAQDLTLPVEAAEPLTADDVMDATAKGLATVAVFGTKVFSVAYSAVTLVVIAAALLGAYLLSNTPVWAGRVIAFALCVSW